MGPKLGFGVGGRIVVNFPSKKHISWTFAKICKFLYVTWHSNVYQLPLTQDKNQDILFGFYWDNWNSHFTEILEYDFTGVYPDYWKKLKFSFYWNSTGIVILNLVSTVCITN